jgi:hypothetical protein
MSAWTDANGKNWADDLDYRLWNPVMKTYQYISLDDAVGKVITMTEVLGHSVTVYVKDPTPSPDNS